MWTDGFDALLCLHIGDAGFKMDKAELDRKILTLIGERWEADKKPLLLSQLGAHDDGAIARTVRQYAPSLSAYVSLELADRAHLIRHSSNPVIVGLVPETPETKGISDFDSLLENCIQTSQTAGKPVRFHQIFWAAFKKPLTPEMRRLLSIGDRLKFRDIDKDEPCFEGEIEVEREFLLGDSENVTDKDIYESIERWIAKNELPSERFSHSFVARRFKASIESGKITLLEYLFKTLDTSELRRINLPMDIVKKLARTRP